MGKLNIQPDYLAVLGDDIDLGFSKAVDIDAVYKEYELINFPIAKDKTKHCRGVNVVTDFLRIQHSRVGKKLFRQGVTCRSINSLCYSKPWQKGAILADYNEGIVDTKLPEAILDNVYKY